MNFFVAPAYNEEMNIGRLIKSLDEHHKKTGENYRLIIVDDGSLDRTSEIVKEYSDRFPCSGLRYFPNQGVQEAFRRGFLKALENAGPEDLIFTLEADGTADLGLVPRFLEKIRKGADIVVASYYAEGGSVEGTVWHRKILSLAGNLFTRLFLRIDGIHTYSSFFRAYRPAALRRVLEAHGDFFEEKGFACVVELLFRLHRLGMRIEEVPMVLKGSARVGKSKMKVLQTISGYIRIALRRAAQDH